MFQISIMYTYANSNPQNGINIYLIFPWKCFLRFYCSFFFFIYMVTNLKKKKNLWLLSLDGEYRMTIVDAWLSDPIRELTRIRSRVSGYTSWSGSTRKNKIKNWSFNILYEKIKKQSMWEYRLYMLYIIKFKILF
jgi:hypothetical protein